MALEAEIIEFPFTTGQNEGTERAVLPPGQFSYLQNARFRKNNRLGKRNGYTSKSSIDANGVALGNGNGRLTCLGPDFCAVDDIFYRRDTVHDNWAAKPSIGVLGSSRQLWNQFPQFLPGPAIEPPVQETLEVTGAAPPYSGMTTGLGFLWVAEGRIYNGSWYACVNAIDPATGKVVFTQDVPLTTATTLDTPTVQLLSMPTPATIVLLTDGFTAGTKTSVQCFTLTDLVNGFSLPSGFTCIESAANYYPTSGNRLLFVHALTGSPTTVRVGSLDPTAGTVTAGATVASAGNKTRLSIFGRTSGQVVIGFYDAATVQIRVFDAAFVLLQSLNLTASIPTALGWVMFAERTVASPYPIVAVVSGSSNDTFALDFDTTGAASTVVMRQRNCSPLSQPFNVGVAQIFLWVRYQAGEGLGVATLVRVPHGNEFPGGAASLPGVFPVQATVDDRNVAPPLNAAHGGPPFPTPLLATNGYNALINYTRSTYINVGTAHYMRSVAIIPVRHRSEGLRYAASCVTPCAGRQFIAAAQPLWVDVSPVAYEAGFIQAPVSIALPIVAAGGALTAGSTYSYTAVFESEVGTVTERSAPAVPVVVVLGANTKITTRWTTMELGARHQVTCKVYRSAANGSVFYLVNKFDATPGNGALGYFDFVDTFADSDIIQNETLYINVGQELAASNVPACTFANVGGNRLWCGGRFTGNIVQASKRFQPHLAPEFADDDAFRVTLPADCTGGAWCDSQVLFTQEGIYIVNGDGPDGAGEGFFTTSRLPFNIGCIDWRSVVVCDLGVMFQSPRGLYLLPRGFGTPVAMDQVLDTLTTYPVITSARSDYNALGGADSSEQIVQWTAVADEAATSGVVVTFDLAYKAFYIDTCGADYPAAFQSGWVGDAVQAPATMTAGLGGAAKWHPFRVRDDGFDDQGLSIDMRATTGDIRPWGTFAHGVVNRVGMLGELRTACELEVRLTTDRGESHWKSRIYDLIAGDVQSGDVIYLEAPLGQPEQRDITSLRVSFHEDSATEGAALFGLYIEHQKTNQGWRLIAPRDRVNVLSNALITESGADVITDENGEQLRTETP